MKKKLLSQVISNVHNAKTRQEKIDILHSNMSPALVDLLIINFDESIEMEVDLDMQYKARKPNDYVETISRSAKKWQSFTTKSNIPLSKKNLRLKWMLESLEPSEAELFLSAARKQIKLGISAKTLQKTFPTQFKFSK
jgi:hypothetical protein